MLKPLDDDLLNSIERALKRQFDSEYGGFGYSPDNPARPKFPEPSNLMFLIEAIDRQKAQGKDAEEARKMLVKTLDQMAIGGIRDHLGGGFHRYSVDRFWHIPHFEKMLYDNGQLTSAYVEGYRLTGNEDYRRIVVEMLEFCPP